MVKRIPLLIAAMAGAAALGTAADARPRDREQDEAYKAAQQGRILPLPLIERAIIPHMGDAEYLGPELDASSSTYRLKFMKQGRVIWLDIDARTGRIRGKSGH